MRPAPAAKTASRVASSASRGTNQTSLCRRESLTRALLGEVVDLGALELARVVDVDRLPLGEDVQRGLPGFAVPVAGVLRAAEREVDLGARRVFVFKREAAHEIAHCAECLVDVAREDRRRETEPDAVRDADRLVEVAHLDQRGRRPEDLL